LVPTTSAESRCGDESSRSCNWRCRRHRAGGAKRAGRKPRPRLWRGIQGVAIREATDASVCLPWPVGRCYGCHPRAGVRRLSAKRLLQLRLVSVDRLGCPHLRADWNLVFCHVLTEQQGNPGNPGALPISSPRRTVWRAEPSGRRSTKASPILSTRSAGTGVRRSQRSTSRAARNRGLTE
jgi:hypothetical protein